MPTPRNPDSVDAPSGADFAGDRPRIPDWTLDSREGRPTLRRRFACHGLSEAVWLTMKIGELAESEGQQPTLVTEPDGVTVFLRATLGSGFHGALMRFAARVDRIHRGH